MALTFKERFKHNLFLWFFGLTKVRMILFCRPKIVDITEEPTGNQCAILNYSMSKVIDEKILMTGDGGDESFT